MDNLGFDRAVLMSRSDFARCGYRDGCFIVQEATRLFTSAHGHAVIGSWIVGDAACGIGIREDASAVTSNMSRFVPHIILG